MRLRDGSSGGSLKIQHRMATDGNRIRCPCASSTGSSGWYAGPPSTLRRQPRFSGRSSCSRTCYRSASRRDLLGNHLFENAKALIFAGCFFEGAPADAWFECGAQVLGKELGEQILPDGGYFELSPMYHSIILEDILDLLSLQQAYPGRPLAEQAWAARIWNRSPYRCSVGLAT